MGIETAAAIAGIVGTLATVGTSVASAVTAQDAPKVQLPQEDPTKTQASLQAAETKQRQQVAARSGKSSTILTSPLGVEEQFQQPTLLGV